LTEATVIELGQQALLMAVLLSAPVMGLALVVGLVISIIQAATQVNEATLTFVPKILAVFAALAIFGPWMVNKMIGYSAALFTSLPSLAR
jgi:flagellar biosynthesis protein FliQ